MPYEIKINEWALKNAANAVDWYEERKKGLGPVFQKALTDCFERIQNNPLAFSYHKSFIRKLKIEGFPYVAFYEVVNDLVYIHDVFNTNQDPNKSYPSNV